MLSSRYRFHGHGSLRFVYAKGRVVRSKMFICKTTTNPRRTNPRVAVVVSKKVMKSAVKRNRIRRRMYEAIRVQMPTLRADSDIVFIVTSPEILTASPDELAGVLRSCFTQADLYKSAEN